MLRMDSNKIGSDQNWRPDLFVPAFIKCGTTAICEYLGQHPSIYVIQGKEPGTLALGETIKAWPLWYGERDRKIEDEPLWSFEKYRRFFSKHDDKMYRVDGTPWYSLIENFPEKLKNFSHDSKMIFMIREQTHRVCSLYLFTYPRHKENDFPVWLKRYFLPYKESFFYYDTVVRFYDVFKNNLIVVENEQLRRHPAKVMEGVFSFLGLKNVNLRPLESNVSMFNPQDSRIRRSWIVSMLKISSTISRIVMMFMKLVGWTEKDDLYYKIARVAPDMLMVKLFSYLSQQKRRSSNDYESLVNQIPASITTLLKDDYEKTVNFCKDKCVLMSVSGEHLSAEN